MPVGVGFDDAHDLVVAGICGEKADVVADGVEADLGAERDGRSDQGTAGGRTPIPRGAGDRFQRAPG
jgi:hypothetical protein